MPVEIERKFLVTGDDWRKGAAGKRICQGYLARSKDTTVRVRRSGGKATITIKGERAGMERPEFEYDIPLEDADAMLAELCLHPLIEKTRYEIEHGGLTWEVDEFEGANAGLVLAEVELEHRDQELDLPPWAGEEVTDDRRYRNSELAERPIGGKS